MRKLLSVAIIILLSPIPFTQAQSSPATTPTGIAGTANLQTADSLRKNIVELANKKATLISQIADDDRKLKEMRTNLSIDEGGRSQWRPEVSWILHLGPARLSLQRNADRSRIQYESILKTIERGEVPSLVQQYVDGASVVQNLRQQLDSYDSYLKQLASKVGPKHPSYQNTQILRDEAQKRLRDTEAEVRTKGQAQLVEDARLDMQNASADLKTLDDQLALAKQNAGELATQLDAYAALSSEATKLRDELDHINISLQNNRRPTTAQTIPSGK